MKRTDTNDPDYFHQVVDCQWGCPAHTDVPEYIRLIAQGRFDDTSFQASLVAFVTALVNRPADGVAWKKAPSPSAA
jgi:hypothetical protein